MEGAQAKRTRNECLDAVGHIQRRKLLRALLVHAPQDDESVNIDSDEWNKEEFERLTGMKQVHLPKLEEYGFITWDRDTNEVSKGPNFEELRPLPEMLAVHGDELATHEDELPHGWL